MSDTTSAWSDQHEVCLEQLHSMMTGQQKTVQQAANLLKKITRDEDLIDEVVAKHLEIAAKIQTHGGPTVFDANGKEDPWYTGPQEGDKFWPALRTSLEADQRWAPAVPSLDKTSTDVLSRLGNPTSDRITTRGLVLGYVQSGKTANFTATITKAADAGYRLFIVLSGVHNSLRRQTQQRLENQITRLNPVDWATLTTEFADFGNPVQGLPMLAGSQLRLLAVVKKNVTRLSNLLTWLTKANESGGLANCPILIIDDEADQATPNSSKNPDLDRTKIHEKIVELLKFPKVAYLGYTATPFANILSNPADPFGIYPRSFIYSLPRPAGYFGAEELFGAAVPEENATADQQPHDMIRHISWEEAGAYKVKAKQPYTPLVTKSLADAVRWFIMATAARRFRQGHADHSSMLIHTTMRVQPQLDMIPVIQKFVRSLSTEWASGNVQPWRAQWETEIEAEPASRHGLAPVSFEEMSTGVTGVLSRIHVLADNGSSSERLLYTADPATVIAIGGNTLSRGLTLEGLVSSFFLRESRNYDSTLQMGRWFGYRPGYADLPRIWTSKDLASDFEFLSDVEYSIRSDISRYSGGVATPRELAVRIQLHPKLKITSALKMYYAVRATSSYSEQRPQTIHFSHRNAEIALHNRRATDLLLRDALKYGYPNRDGRASLLVNKVPVDVISAFLEEYEFHPSSEMSDDTLLGYIKEQNAFGSLLEWNVAVAGLQRNSQSLGTVSLNGADYNLINRARLKNGSDESTAYIKALMSPADLILDMPNASEIGAQKNAREMRNECAVPLLLIYPISKDSVPESSSKAREPLDAVEHQIGLGLSLPAAAPDSEPKDMVQVDLSRVTANAGSNDELDEDYVYEDTEGSHNELNLDAD